MACRPWTFVRTMHAGTNCRQTHARIYPYFFVLFFFKFICCKVGQKGKIRNTERILPSHPYFDKTTTNYQKQSETTQKLPKTTKKYQKPTHNYPKIKKTTKNYKKPPKNYPETMENQQKPVCTIFSGYIDPSFCFYRHQLPLGANIRAKCHPGQNVTLEVT